MIMRAVRICSPLALYIIAAFAQQNSKIPVFGTTVVVSSGLRGQIYFIHHGAKRLPDFSHLKPRGAIYTSELNIPPQDFQLGFPGISKRKEWFAIDYAGKFWIREPGPYRFSLTSDDGSQLYIDDLLVIDNDGVHPPETRLGDINLNTGIHRIRIAYFQGPKYQVALVLEVAPPGETNLRIFSTDEFKPPPNPEDWPSSAPSSPSAPQK